MRTSKVIKLRGLAPASNLILTSINPFVGMIRNPIMSKEQDTTITEDLNSLTMAYQRLASVSSQEKADSEAVQELLLKKITTTVMRMA